MSPIVILVFAAVNAYLCFAFAPAIAKRNASYEAQPLDFTSKELDNRQVTPPDSRGSYIDIESPLTDGAASQLEIRAEPGVRERVQKCVEANCKALVLEDIPDCVLACLVKEKVPYNEMIYRRLIMCLIFMEWNPGCYLGIPEPEPGFDPDLSLEGDPAC
jgi:hypothetical protein